MADVEPGISKPAVRHHYHYASGILGIRIRQIMDAMHVNDRIKYLVLLDETIKLVTSLDSNVIWETEKVCRFGAEKYGMDSYLTMQVGVFFDAAFRHHFKQFFLDEQFDSESGLSHNAHLLANLMIIKSIVTMSSNTNWNDLFILAIDTKEKKTNAS